MKGASPPGHPRTPPRVATMALAAAIIAVSVATGTGAAPLCAGPMPCSPTRPSPDAGALFVVTNRGGGSVSLVDPAVAAVVDTYALPDGASHSRPAARLERSTRLCV